jgi:GT2 family glycosyltransferase
MSAPQVTIVVLIYNGLADTLACLSSLAMVDYPNFKVVVVDNASSDGSVLAIRQAYPQVEVLETGQNLGYAEGNNVGIRHALKTGADYVLLLNNDTVVAADFLTHLVNAAEADPAVGIAGPTIYYFSSPTVIWSAGGAVDWQRGLTSMIGLDEPDTGQFGQSPRLVDFVTGCALLIKRTVLEQVGLLDPRFFMYYEETEWCTRAKRANCHIIYVPESKLWHKIAPAQQNLSPRVHYYMTRNRLLFLQTSRAPVKTWFYVLVFDNLRTLLIWSLRPKWRHMRSQRNVMLKAIRDFWLGRFGQAKLI